jgi:hypothetical protein
VEFGEVWAFLCGRRVFVVLGAPTVRRCSSLSTSFVLAALRALQVDSSCVSGADRRDRGKLPSQIGCLGPVRWVVGGVVTDHRVGDTGSAVRQGTSDDPAVLAA